MIDLYKLLDEVPDYQTFLTLDEMYASSRQLAEEYPDVVSILPLGQSRRGHSIEALKIGDGAKTGFMVGLPHPNEPIGAMLVEFFSRKLAEDAALRDSLGYTWYLIKAVDPDGTRLNEGWYKGPFTIANYARHFYRPPSQQQVEWTFPVDYKTYSFHDPLPETQAWMKLIETHPPDFLFSLHNAGFGGVYLYLSHDVPGMYAPFYELVERTKLPLHLGEPEVPFATTYSKAIYHMLGLADNYDFLAQNLGGDPAAVMSAGASSYEYAKRFGNPLFLVCEMPYFFNAAINDLSEADVVRRDVMLEGLKARREKWLFMKEQIEQLGAALTVQSPFRDALTMFLPMITGHMDAEENYVKGNPELAKKATQAEVFDNRYGKRFYTVLIMGMFVRLLETQLAEGGENAAVRAALQTAREAFDQEGAFLEKAIEYSVIPIRKLVQVQLGTALLMLEHAQQ